jgi:ATP-dependent Clp protease, protease subunit
MTRRWYDFRAQARGAEIVIYDEIGAFGIPAKTFLDELKALGPVAELTVRINSPGGSVFDGVAIYNALKRHDAAITVWIDGIAASIASMIAMAGDEVVMPENAMLMLHDPSGLVMGTATDMRGMAEALDRMKTGMVAAYRDKSGRDDAEIEALMAAETWLSAREAVALGLADRIDQPVRMAAHFDLSRFRNTPPQLAALAPTLIPQEDAMSDSKKARPPRPHEATSAVATEQSPEQIAAAESDRPAEAAEPVPTPAAAQPTAQVIDLDAVRADERRATLAYVAEVHELCALAGRGDLAAGFIAKATPVAQVRRVLLETRAAEDDATAIRSQVRPTSVEPTQPAIDTAAIYAARNQHCR